MRRRKSGWGPDDLRTLYEGFGFARREGANHTVYTHPNFPHLRGTVPRHKKLQPYVAEQAVSCLDELARLKAEEEAKRADP
jgi:hypothetical protein